MLMHSLCDMHGTCRHCLFVCHREKEQPGRMRYASYWRPTPGGKTDYLSITIINGTTAQVRGQGRAAGA